MKDKIIVITGATRGLGLRLKEDLSKDNVVVTLSRSEVENGKTAFKADVSDFDDVKRVFNEIGKIYGKIDVLINNAGYGLSGATEIMRKEEIERITNVNFLGAIWCTKCALPYMTKGAKIAVISSASGLTPMPFRTMYNSTKAALTMFSYSMKLELCNLGIDCTAFILGPVNTGFSNNRTVVTAEDSRYFKDVKEVDDFVKIRTIPKNKRQKVSAYIIKNLEKPTFDITISSDSVSVLPTYFTNFSRSQLSALPTFSCENAKNKTPPVNRRVIFQQLAPRVQSIPRGPISMKLQENKKRQDTLPFLLLTCKRREFDDFWGSLRVLKILVYAAHSALLKSRYRGR